MQIQTEMESPMEQMLSLMTLMMENTPIAMVTVSQTHTTQTIKNHKQVQAMEAPKVVANPKIMDKAKEKVRAKVKDKDKDKGRVKDKAKVKVKVRGKVKDKDRAKDKDKAKVKVRVKVRVRVRDKGKDKAKVKDRDKDRDRDKAPSKVSKAIKANKVKPVSKAKIHHKANKAVKVDNKANKAVKMDNKDSNKTMDKASNSKEANKEANNPSNKPKSKVEPTKMVKINSNKAKPKMVSKDNKVLNQKINRANN